MLCSSTAKEYHGISLLDLARLQVVHVDVNAIWRDVSWLLSADDGSSANLHRAFLMFHGGRPFCAVFKRK